MTNYLFTVEKFHMSLKVTNKTNFNLHIHIDDAALLRSEFLVPPMKFGMINDEQLDVTKLHFKLERKK